MKLTLPDSVVSPQDLASLISDVHAYSAWASHQLIKQRMSAKTPSPQPAVSAASIEVITAWSEGKPLSQKSIDELTVALDAYKKKAPVVTITLAAMPSGDLKTKIIQWFRREVRPDTLVSFRMNRQILGGMVVTSGSRIHDWSYRRVLLTRKTSFSEVLRHV